MRVAVKVLPRSSKNEVIGFMADGTLKVKLTVAPVDGKANAALLVLLGKYWNCAPSALSIVSGKTSSKKIIERL